ncbi:hypothetical protein [Streptosporangium vulgare]|uniref:hypothetical protein n=1 Tax=Streptosporangium vulgare TaxID=46190 RepID=UPI0031DB12BA
MVAGLLIFLVGCLAAGTSMSGLPVLADPSRRSSCHRRPSGVRADHRDALVEMLIRKSLAQDRQGSCSPSSSACSCIGYALIHLHGDAWGMQVLFLVIGAILTIALFF